MSCAKCNTEIKNKKDAVSCTECNRQFHANCVRGVPPAGRPSTRSGVATPWRCEDCIAETSSVNSRSDNDLDPVNVMSMLKIMRREMTEDRNTTAGNFEKITSSINLVQVSIEDLKSKISLVEKEHGQIKKDVSTLQAENSQLTRQLQELSGRMHDLEQYSRIGNLEIRGVPLSTGEDVLAIIGKLADVLKINFSSGDISICHRLPAPRDSRFHPPIVAQFTSRTTRPRWLAAAKLSRPKTTDLAPNFRPGMIFISEHLTAHNKMILGRARRLVKAGNLAYAWSKEGKLFVRRSPSSSVVRVWSVADVESVAGIAGSTASNSGGHAGSEAAATATH